MKTGYDKLTALHLTPRYCFYVSGHIAYAEYIKSNDSVSFRLRQYQEPTTIAVADFLDQFGDCTLDCDRPECGTIGERLAIMRVLPQELHDLYIAQDSNVMRP